MLDGDLRVERANPAFYAPLAVAADDTEGRLVDQSGDGQWMTAELRQNAAAGAAAGGAVDGYVVDHEFPRIGRADDGAIRAQAALREGGQGADPARDRGPDGGERAAQERERLLELETEARQRAEERTG